MTTDYVKLDSVMATFVSELGEIGIFHFNKLAYLFEYLFIKNFGKRYTKEQFVKLPHGPVVINYKKYISDLKCRNLVDVDLKSLKVKRLLDDDLAYERVSISQTIATHECIVKNPVVYRLVKKVAETYGTLSSREIEKAVYATNPVRSILNKISEGQLKKTGTYILNGNGIRMKDYDSLKTKSRRAYLDHVEKYPTVKVNLQKKLSKELSFLSEMRPSYE